MADIHRTSREVGPVRTHPTPGFRITEVWAWTVVDPEDGEEGIPALQAADGTALPLIAADRNRLEAMRPWVQDLADAHGMPLTLKRFTEMAVVETVEPRTAGG